ncbi:MULTISPECIES: hypothetical protein [Methylorubrum]|uniref:LPXTG cell wall anchor domain-containing protein n=1 Tax=Methylorubrum suomiense TaxID=144191 RepID=A0ABQ4UYK8_9HYPH|nr:MULTISPECIES: hypothetical protein [Methylobacteriaceae]GJE76172.1 hypothetical protein BGCPKDLD_2764 [Methylorubrum suomiense]
MRAIATAVPFWALTVHQGLAQQMNPAPPIPESGPSGSSSPAATAAAIDFNWVWISLLIALAALGLWLFARRRQSGPPRS